ncbi:MAG: glycosyltransferase [Deltaproteobacteria bacterium]|nr:glycosyltransferase [Deltaproteobacteria bacterium]
MPTRRYAQVATVTPALNEERVIGRTLAALPEVGWRVVADNGSTDRTAQIAAAAGAVVIPEPRRGYGQAVHTAASWALSAGAAYIAVVDADFADAPERLPLLLEPLLRGEADLVLSDRTDLALPSSLFPQQRWGNALAVEGMAAVIGHRFRDMGPMRAMTAAAWHRLAQEDRTWGWNVEMQMKAVQRGLRVVELPAPYRVREGVSKISGTVRGTLAAGRKILTSIWRYR